MSKEKIIGLSVLGVLATTMAGVGAWRFMGSGGPAHDQSAVTADAENKPDEEKTTEPTVLSSATGTGNSELADRLAGKTGVSGSWNSSSSIGNSVDSTPPALPSNSARYPDSNSGEATFTATVADQERHPSYMPKESTISTESAGVVEEAVQGRYGSSADLTSEVVSGDNGEIASGGSESTGSEGSAPAQDASSTPATDPYGAIPYDAGEKDPAVSGEVDTVQENYAAMSSRIPKESASGEVIQIVESTPPAIASQQNVVDPAAEQLARRAADEAQFAEAYARVEEAVQIPESAIETRNVPDLSQPAGSSATIAQSPVNDPAAEPAPPARFNADSRFAADARYVNEAADQENASSTYPKVETVSPAEPAYGSSTPVASATPTAGEAPYQATTPPGPVAGYRDSASRTQASSPPTQTAPAADPYRSNSTSTGVAAQPVGNSYGTPARTTSLPNTVAATSTNRETGPTRENTGKYYVEPGESFWTIAQKVYGSGGFFKALQEHNRARFINPSDMQVGDEVLTPTEAELRERYSGLCPKVRVAKPGSPAAQPASTQPVSHSAGMAKYEVQEGDTLYDIAKYELGDAQRWPEIFKLNRSALGVDIDYVKPGTVLVLPTDAPLESEPNQSYEGDVLTRRPGNSLK